MKNFQKIYRIIYEFSISDELMKIGKLFSASGYFHDLIIDLNKSIEIILIVMTDENLNYRFLHHKCYT